MAQQNRVVPSIRLQNGPFQLSNDNGSNRLMNDYVTEGLMIGGTPVLVYKLLGIHEQKELLPLHGTPIAHGEYPEFPVENVFQDDETEWHSVKRMCVRDPNTYIGYDFGPIKLPNTDIDKYAIHSETKYHVTSVYLQQGALAKNRITKARIERSDDGNNWFGVAILNIIDDDQPHWIDIKQSAPSRYWRIVPTQYNSDELWIVKKLSFSEYTKTNITNIQDEMGFMENRDRSYSTDPINMKAYYSLIDVTTDLGYMGIDLKNQYQFRFGFDMTVQQLNRPIVIGDILDVLCEVQYDTQMNPVKKYLEVTDVGWDSGSFTPGWQPTIYSVVAQPMIASQETMDIVGDLNNDFFDSLDAFNTTPMKASKKIRAEADTEVPEVGGSYNDTVIIPDEIIERGLAAGYNLKPLNPNPKEYLLEDAMPPNGLPYTEGDTYPTSPSNRDYHRLTYSSVADPIPTRLYQYSAAKQRWIFMEEDKRMRSNSKKPTVDKFLDGVDITKLGKK